MNKEQIHQEWDKLRKDAAEALKEPIGGQQLSEISSRLVKLLWEPEQVSEAVYEIVKYRQKNTDNIWDRVSVGQFLRVGYSPWDECEIEKDDTMEIYSVKRLSDSEVLTVGDKIESSISKTLGVFTITGFRIDENAQGGMSVIVNPVGESNRNIQMAITTAVKYHKEIVSMEIDGKGYRLSVKDAELIKTKAMMCNLLDPKLHTPVQELETKIDLLEEENLHQKEEIKFMRGQISDYEAQLENRAQRGE